MSGAGLYEQEVYYDIVKRWILSSSFCAPRSVFSFSFNEPHFEKESDGFFFFFFTKHISSMNLVLVR